jgi:hypothetical protein
MTLLELDKLTLDVKALLDFYDSNRSVQMHSNAIKTVAGEELGFALLIEYFRRVGVIAEKLQKNAFSSNGTSALAGLSSCHCRLQDGLDRQLLCT